KETHHVGEHREPETREDLLGDSGAPDHPAFLQHQHLAPGLGQVGGGYHGGVPPSHHDHVVSRGHQERFLSGSKNGFGVTRAVARYRRYSTVISISSSVPGAPAPARTVAKARFC